ncbi:MAG: undecaprenyl/decaprenyl-phosphate alpha-N-acetylglucosaminyl 1-phosphate transferase [Bacteroidales bacterium]|nr:undecaprenyl/decaprenyl-phosphate alpha-N-acetylglucosaminyl 1-phosphate transferase [Bacteroidales bacterium]
MNNIYYFIIFFFITFLVSFLENKFFLKKSIKINFRKSNISAIRWETQTKPIFGGITFYSIFLLTIIYFYFFVSSSLSTNNIVTIVIVSIAFFMGLADDLLSTSPHFKFLFQLLIATILVYFGIYINITQYVFLNYFITYFWVIGIMNSINMLDNMDAISSSISISILIGVVLNIILSGNVSIFEILITIATIASLASYLLFNWHPSKLYMGDNGSQFLGAILAILGILFFWNYNNSFMHTISLSKQFLITLIAFIVPITDTTSVTINRLLKKKSPFIGGKDHTTHHLSYLGFSDQQVAIILMLISFLSVLISIYIANYIIIWKTIHIVIYSFYAFVIFITLYSITRISKPNK